MEAINFDKRIDEALDELKSRIDDRFTVYKSQILDEVKKELPKREVKYVSEKEVDFKRLPMFMKSVFFAIGEKKPLETVINAELDKTKSLKWEIFRDEMKAMSVGDLSSGGALVPDSYLNELIPELQERSVIERVGVKVVNSTTGNLSLPIITEGSTLHWVGEGQPHTTSTIKTKRLNLNAKKGTIAVPISNDLLRQNTYNVDEYIMNDIASKIALGQDAVCIRGSGGDYKPKGLYYWLPSSQKFNQTGTAETNWRADLIKAEGLVEIYDGVLERPAWLMATRTKSALKSLTNAQSMISVIAQQLETNNTILGHPVFTSQFVPTNLGTGNNKTEVYFVDWGKCVLLRGFLNIMFVPYASYWDGAKTVSGLATDESLFAGWVTVDFGIKYDSAGAIIENVA